MSECEDMTEGQNGATAFTGCTGKQAWTRLTFTRKHLKDEELPMSWENCVLCVMFSSSCCTWQTCWFVPAGQSQVELITLSTAGLTELH